MLRVIDTSDCNLEISDWVRLRKLFHLFNGVSSALFLQGFIALVLFGIFAYHDDLWKPIVWIILLSIPSFFMFKLTRAFFSRYGRTSIYKLEINFLILQVLLSFYWGLSFAMLILHIESLNTTILFIEVFFISISLGFYLYSYVCYFFTVLLISAPTVALFFYNTGAFTQLGYLFIVYLIFYLVYARYVITSVGNVVRLQTLNENLNKQLLVVNKQLVEESSTDYLTRIANRRTFMSAFNREWSRALRQVYPISVMVLDVDWFKKYNDYYGHLMGDDALRAIADSFTKIVSRPGDVVARYGGEEFSAVLSNTDLSGAMLLAEKILTSIQDLSIPHSQSVFNKITVSIGIYSNIPQRTDNYLDYIKYADIALYTAKKNGRNRAEIYNKDMKKKAPDST